MLEFAEVNPVELRDVAVEVAQEAARLIREKRVSIPDLAAHTETKSSAVDPVTEVDTASEELIVARLRELRPDDGLIGEEGDSWESTSGVTWVADPIDGTVNFLYGLPQYAVSIAAAYAGEIIAGVVINVVTGELYRAARGHGAQRVVGETCTELRASSATDPAVSLVATGFSYSAERRARQAAILQELLPRVRDIRRMGAAALDLCHVATGEVDAYYEHGTHPWDWGAGSIVAEEAGAVVHTPRLDAPDGGGELVYAAGPQLAGPMERLLAASGALKNLN